MEREQEKNVVEEEEEEIHRGCTGVTLWGKQSKVEEEEGNEQTKATRKI